MKLSIVNMQLVVKCDVLLMFCFVSDCQSFAAISEMDCNLTTVDMLLDLTNRSRLSVMHHNTLLLYTVIPKQSEQNLKFVYV